MELYIKVMFYLTGACYFFRFISMAFGDYPKPTSLRADIIGTLIALPLYIWLSVLFFGLK